MDRIGRSQKLILAPTRIGQIVRITGPPLTRGRLDTIESALIQKDRLTASSFFKGVHKLVTGLEDHLCDLHVMGMDARITNNFEISRTGPRFPSKNRTLVSFTSREFLHVRIE
jgi:hypothetical protein